MLITNTRRLERIEAKLDMLLEDAGLEIELEEQVDATATVLKETIGKLSAEVAQDNEDVVNASSAIAAAGEKFTALKEQIEKLTAGVPLTDAEIEALNTEATTIDTGLGEANGHLVEHTTKLSEDTAAA